MCALLCTTGIPSAEEVATTNSIPTNIFLTDENRLFSYKNGKRLIDAKRVKDAEKAKESRPADQDPEGHWGKVVDGFQLSLRFERQEFSNGEPIIVSILMRNVSDKRLTYIRETVNGRPSPIYVAVWKEQEKLKLETDDNLVPRASATKVDLYPRTQHRYRLRLDKFYDLSKPGVYSVQAEYGPLTPIGPFPVRGLGQEPIISQKVNISITNTATR
jgi:hypothetical protein